MDSKTDIIFFWYFVYIYFFRNISSGDREPDTRALSDCGHLFPVSSYFWKLFFSFLSSGSFCPVPSCLCTSHFPDPRQALGSIVSVTSFDTKSHGVWFCLWQIMSKQGIKASKGVCICVSLWGRGWDKRNKRKRANPNGFK